MYFILDGKKCADGLLEDLKEKFKESEQNKSLAIIQIGDDESSNIYIRNKKRACEKMGIGFQLKKFPTNYTDNEILQEIGQININPEITGCIIQLPIPAHLNKRLLLDAISPEKDIDCLGTNNLGMLLVGKPNYLPATVLGIITLLQYYHIDTKGKCCVIIGKSDIVGKPLQVTLSNENSFAATTILCDKYTENIYNYTKMADILIVAAGKHHIINDPAQIKMGAVVIDVGIHRVNGKIEGDVDFEKVKNRCSYITPVPRGVGPLTVAGLLYNLVGIAFPSQRAYI